MNSHQVAAELNLSLNEFQKIEDSIASILGLSRDSEGNFEYGAEDLSNLKEVFLDQHSGSKKQDVPMGIAKSEESEQWKQSMAPILDSGAPSKISLGTNDSERPNWSQPVINNLDQASLTRATDESQESIDEVQVPPVHEARVHTPRDTRLQIPGFERLRRDESGEVRMADYEHAWNRNSLKPPRATGNLNQQFKAPYPVAPEEPRNLAPNGEELENNIPPSLDSKESIEKRLRELEMQDLHHLREENLFIKKENLALRKEIQTLENIIRNQDNDRLYLVQRLNEKFTLKRLLQWKLHGEDSFGGHMADNS